jgi:hypothetical protein
MTWDELARALNATPDDNGWLRVTRRMDSGPRQLIVQHVLVGEWELALVQMSFARESQLGTAEAAMRLVPFPLGALVFNDGCWVLRQALPLDGLTIARFEVLLRCLDLQARRIIPQRPHTTVTELFSHYAD